MQEAPTWHSTGTVDSRLSRFRWRGNTTTRHDDTTRPVITGVTGEIRTIDVNDRSLCPHLTRHWVINGSPR